MVYAPRAQSGNASAVPADLPRGKSLTEDQLQAILKNEIRQSVAYMGDEVSEDQRKALEYFYGEPFGGEQEGRSQVISMDVQDTIQGMMPDFMEIFAGGDRPVEFEPVGEEDEQYADQATEYVTHIWSKDNDGFSNTYDWVFDALLQKNGILKVWWDDTPQTRKQTLEGVNELQAYELANDESVEILEAEQGEDGLVTLKVEKTLQNGRIKVQCIPPEEFLISQRATEIDTLRGEPVCPFAAHRTKKTASDLIEEGFDPDTIKNIPGHDEQTANEVRQSRFNVDETYPDYDDALDPAMREIWVYECYLLVDFDGDGIAELRQVTVAGPGYDILVNEEVEEYPFIGMTPIRIPHKFYGRAIAELVMDIQLIKSTLQRQFLDNIYFINNQRYFLNDRVDMDSWLNQRPGGGVMVEGSEPVSGVAEPVMPVPLGQVILPALEYFDSVSMARTGYTKYSQGLDADSLNKTATGIAQILSRAQMRMLLVARLFAENGFARAFAKILRLTHRHQDKPRMLRLRDSWVPIDPRPWNVDMDVTINVGLGHGTKQEKAGMMTQLLAIQKEIIAAQGGPGGPVVDWKRLYNGLKQMVVALGMKSADPFFIDPESNEGKQKIEEAKQRAQSQPNPDMMKVQVEAQKAQADAQQKAQETQMKGQEMQQKAQSESQKMQAEYEFKVRQMEEEYGFKWAQLQLEAAKVGLDVEAKEREIEIEQDNAGREYELRREEMSVKQDTENKKLESDRQKTDREYEDREKARESESKEKAKDRRVPKEKKPEKEAKPEQPIINVSIGDDEKKVTVERDEDGKITGANVTKGK
jgi:hypothetical protein